MSAAWRHWHNIAICVGPMFVCYIMRGVSDTDVRQAPNRSANLNLTIIHDVAGRG